MCIRDRYKHSCRRRYTNNNSGNVTEDETISTKPIATLAITHASMRRTNHMSMSEGITSILDPNRSNPAAIEGMATNLEARMAAI